MRLVAKERVGAKVIKRYDKAKMPYQTLNPIAIRGELHRRLESLWAFALQSDSSTRPQLVESQVSRCVPSVCGETIFPPW